jgi:cell shape-determining protein MreC
MTSGAPGYAVLELVNVALTVVNAAKAFVSAFSGKWDNASFELKVLDGHYQQAEYYFQTLQQNIGDAGQEYPNYQVLQRTLQEYKEFLAEYKPLLEMEIDEPQRRFQTLRSHTKSLETTKNTAQWVFARQKAIGLKQRIITCTEEINRFNNSISK